MGRHRRVNPAAAARHSAPGHAAPHAPAAVPGPSTELYRGTLGDADGSGAGRRGSHRRRKAAPVRTGMLGVSAAMALGAVAVGSGLVPGVGGLRLDGDEGPATSVQADGVPDAETAGTSASPRPDESAASRDDRRSASPSVKPSTSPDASKSPKPSATPDASTTQPGPPATKPAPEPERRTTTAPPAADTGPSRETTPPAGREETQRPAPQPQEPGVHSEAEARVLTLVNQERAAAGCSALRADPGLAALAGDYSRDMAERGFFSHTDPDGRSPWDRAEAAGVSHMGGENIARGQADAEAVMEAWMNSPGHRANILNCDFQTLGVGGHFASGGPWWTQNFGF
ncbi:CAP domain-containing protein [Streptomyces sp. TRM 70351]|uniref:CAP domain-containing protein n=1 Tax=Streptomyces sp. TRM 70351 TaxID=3116552 RepID=UPI002E7AD8F2|nr:CAP domain-containing protein [Streptomyces sp. TRM 70351]MEE1931157.1 CAP domain-containing protein [Streptomyces sp. TRM 70351]